MALNSLKLHKLQMTRRTVQFLILILFLTIPAVSRYTNYLNARELEKFQGKWEGTFQGYVLDVLDTSLRSLPDGEIDRMGRMVRNRTRILDYTEQIRGGPWALSGFNIHMVDLLAGAESIAATRTISRVLLLGLIIPICVTLLLGRVFCSWICPANLFLELTDKLRKLLVFLEIHPFDMHISRKTKYIFLGAGLCLTLFLAIPILSYLYPPSIFGLEFHHMVSRLFDFAEDGNPGLHFTGWNWMILFIIGIAVTEISFSRRWWCRYACPGGALYCISGSYRLIKIKRDPNSCVRCGDCNRICPMGLEPMSDSMGMECDNCGLCLSNCPQSALSYSAKPPIRKQTVKPIVLILAILLLAGAPPVMAHHILGIPHYAYDERYPQTPVLTFVADAGANEIKMTGYPGKPKVGERCSFYVYIQRKADGKVFEDTVTMSVFKDRMMGTDDLIYGPQEAALDQSMYKFYPEFDEEANYTIRIEFEAESAPWMIDLPFVVGDPGSPLAVLGGYGAGLILFLIIIRAARIKLQRNTTQTAAGEI